jgi:Carboxypeptidase regulatory-like domain
MFPFTAALKATGFKSIRVLLVGFAFFICVFTAGQANAATFTINQTGDAGDGTCDATCTLRDAIANANTLAGADTIVFASPLFDTAKTIDLTSAELLISDSVTVTGRGARLLTVGRAIGNPTNFRIFNITAGTVGISGMTISNGNVTTEGAGILNGGGTVTLNAVAVLNNVSTGTSNDGGGVRNASGTMTLLNSLVSGNSSGFSGGGIRNNAVLSIANTTISGNSAPGTVGPGGGSGIDNNGTLNMNNVTVTNNSATNGSGGNVGGVFARFNGVNTVNTRNTIISDNTAPGSNSPDVEGTFTSNGNNLIGNTTGSTGFSSAAPTNDRLNITANLGSLQNNGGQTDSHLPDRTSQSLNTGNNCVVTTTCPANNPPIPLTFDQRGTGFPRLLNSTVDIGAIESQLVPSAASVSVSGTVTTPEGRALRGAVVIMSDGQGNTRRAVSSSFGYYSFDDVTVGQTYILNVASKRYQFGPQVVTVDDEMTGVNFTGQ